jgi:hypothetical protein
MAGDWPDIPFLQAADYTPGRPDGPPLWIVVHTMEEEELSDTAEAVARYFASGSGDRSVSSHYTVDADSAVQCVRLGDVAWTVGNRAGNYRGINYELAGTASQTAAQWADAYSQSMLRRFAAIARRDMAKFGIPARWCSIDALKSRLPGLTTHNDLRVAFGGTTHTDPGPAFPFAQVLQMITGEDDMLTEQQAKDLDITKRIVDNFAAGKTSWTSAGGGVFPIVPNVELAAVRAEVAALRAALDGITSGSADTAAILAGVDERLAALRAQVQADVDTELDEQSRAGADAD